MEALRIPAKIILLSLSFLLTIFAAVAIFVVERFAGLLNILSGFIFIAALAPRRKSCAQGITLT
ncbi:MAG: hypothetical protein FWH55_01410 [Oscillospiraceae bacterium]|nr:hypothetical protein [Oscillospiraceae bacterium]